MAALSRPDGMLDEMQRRLGPYMKGNETTVEGDETKTRYSIDILRSKRPGFMTIHLSSLDETEHETGPFSAEADKTLEAIDGMVARLAAAARAADPATVVLIVSDHGFAQVTHHVNLAIPFLKAGLIETSGEGDDRAITGWKAQLWAAGGMEAVMLHDSNDQADCTEGGRPAAHAGGGPEEWDCMRCWTEMRYGGGEGFLTRRLWWCSSSATTRATRSRAIW